MGIGDGQGGLACCSPWGRVIGHDWATELNWTDASQRGVIQTVIFFLFLAPDILIVAFSNIFSWEITFHFVLRCLWIFLSFYSAFLEKAMAPHASTLAWKIPWTEEPGGLQSVGSPRVGHDWATSLSLFTFMHWRRKWQPTPVLLPGESQGRRSLVAFRLWGRTESDTTEAT